MKVKQQKFKQVSLEELNNIFKYNPCTGELLQNKVRVNHKLTGDNDYSVWYSVNKRQYKVTAIEICYALQTGKYSEYKIRTKDLDNSNLKFSNLITVSYEHDRRINTALLNLRKYLKVSPAMQDQNSYIVKCYNEVLITKRFDTTESAGDYVRKYKLKLLKELEKLNIDINSKYLYESFCLFT